MRICPTCQSSTEARRCPSDGAATIDRESLDTLPDDIDWEAFFDGRYYREERIGRGAFADIYRARQLEHDTIVALKILRSVRAENQRHVERFEREARALEAMSHPHIVEIFDFGESEEGRLYIEMEYLEGEPLSETLERQGALSPERTCRLAISTLEALREVHAQGVTHRDLAPNNLVFVDRARDALTLIDFGIAHVTHEGSMTLTEEGEVLGSPRYMAPEQWTGDTITPKTDLYAFGAVFYRVLAGRPVFERETVRSQLAAALFEDPSPPVVEGTELEGPLIEALMACLRREPEARPDLPELLEQLRECREAPLRRSGTSSPLEVSADPLSELTMEMDQTLVSGNYTPSDEESGRDGEARALVHDAIVSPRHLDSTPSDSEGPEAPETVRSSAPPSEAPPSHEDSEATPDEEEDLVTKVAMASLFVSIPAAFAGLGWLLFVDSSSPDSIERSSASASVSDVSTSSATTTGGDVSDRSASDGTTSETSKSTSRDTSQRARREDYLRATQSWLRGRHQLALEQCRRGLKKGARDCHKIIGLVHRDMGNKQKACASFIQYLKTDPVDADEIRERMEVLHCQ